MRKTIQIVSCLSWTCGLLISAEALSNDVATATPGKDFGVLVMAHGGKDAWNEAVLDAVRPLKDHYPTSVAFGMASAATLQEATDELEAQGVRQIAVVRLFVSGESWLERTRQILGLQSGAPPKSDAPAHHSGSGHHDLEAKFWRIDSDSEFALSRQGLSEAGEMGLVLLDRARGLSTEPTKESVLILAHGPADDEENQRWIENLERLADPLREELPFRAVAVHTLREDWDDKREVAEERIRDFVETAGSDGGRCLVIPFRVFGFGPYAEVLEGLDYESDGKGLIPHQAISSWLSRQAEALSHGPFTPVVDLDDSPKEAPSTEHPGGAGHEKDGFSAAECLDWVDETYRLSTMAANFGLELAAEIIDNRACMERDTQLMAIPIPRTWCDNVFKIHCSGLDLLAEIGDAQVAKCETDLSAYLGIDIGSNRAWTICGEQKVFDRYSMLGNATDEETCRKILLEECGAQIED